MRFHLFPFRTEKLSSLTPMVLHLSCGRVGSRLFKVRSQGLTFFCCFSAWKRWGGAAPLLFARLPPPPCVGACSVKLSCRMTAVMRAGLPEERPDCRAGSVGCGLFPYRLDSSAEVAPSDTAVSHSTRTARFCQARPLFSTCGLVRKLAFEMKRLFFQQALFLFQGKRCSIAGEA